jgi:hypothetical protein
VKRTLAAGLSIALFAGEARAEPPGALRGEARTIATEGDTQFYGGRCDKAIELWIKADAIFHAPTLGLRVARCQALMGKVVAAAATLEALVREPAPAGASPAFSTARETAAQDLARVRARIATLRFSVRQTGGSSPVSIAIDGSPALSLPAARQSEARLSVDPGVRRVRVSADGASWEREIRLDDAEERAVDVPLWIGSQAIPPPQRVAGLAVLSTGITALTAGAGVALARRDDHGATIGAGVAIGGGVLLAATGAVLLSVDVRPARAKVGAAPGGVVVSGSF